LRPASASVKSLDPGEAERAFTRVQGFVLRVLRRRDFRLIRTSPCPPIRAPGPGC